TQKLLASSGDFNYLTYWKSMNFASWTGVPNESVDGRIAEIEEYEAWYDKASPENKTGHAMETHEPEEEFCILMQSGFDGSYYGFYHVPSFLDWVAKQPPEIKEEYLRDALKYLQWQGLSDPNKRWMLKSPMHNGSEEALLKAFPDATLIMTHREPTSTVPSACKLNTHLKKVFSDRPVEYPNTAGFLAAQMDSHIQFKATHPDIPILDIYYTDVIDDVAATMQRIYDFCHEPLSEASLRRILEWDAANPKNKHGAFKYSPEEFGFTNESIQAQFGEYYEFLKARFPDKVS
ncbi:MAG: sulfotransferase family protein, partial [bacterium]